ncbi:hypothetical protein H6F61_18375 [Cyanobacteria bacterium FACHB-472]|nr:hypothetical protein [Cyanobacteria bacterium FACHB-472]
MEPSESQYLILNALDSFGLLGNTIYDEETGIWYIQTPSPILPIARLSESGDILPIEPELEL